LCCLILIKKIAGEEKSDIARTDPIRFDILLSGFLFEKEGFLLDL